jgi:MoCo/4Fe-4S cofactor protein with predicted Tat translocation signal
LLGLPSLIVMKTRLLPAQIELRQGGPRFWKSLEEWSQSPEFLPYLHREFPEYASEWNVGISRRRFLQLMGASFALAGLTACSRQPQEKIIPYVRRPEEIIPGRPIYYATTFPHRGYGKGIIVRTEMGRPIHIEGNPDHPASLGATDSFMQASILGLYDPDRSQVIRQGKDIQTWDGFTQFTGSQVLDHEKDQGAGLFLLTGKITSPSLLDQFGRLHQRFPKLTWCEYETAEPLRVRAVSGKKAEPDYNLSKADIIISLDADFLAEGPAHLIHIKAFSKRRRDPATGFNRLYVVESVPTITGAKADQRWSRRPSDIIALAREMADAILHQKPATTPEVQRLVTELLGKPGRSVIIAGDYQPEIVHALAFQMNQALGNIGATVRYAESPESNFPRVSLAAFVEALKSGAARTLLITGPNPIYDLPTEIGFVEALAKIPHSIHLGLYDDETGSLCKWHVPESHYLEAWGDALALDGTPSLIQPMIESLYPGSASLLELISLFIDVPPLKGYDIVHRFWQGKLREDASNSWSLSLNKGIVTGLPPGAFSAAIPVTEILPPNVATSVNESNYEILFRPDSSADDGRYANNGWLQELPRPLSKLTWDNVAMISPKSAEVLGVKAGDVVELKAGDGSVPAPIWIQPGHADGCVSVTLGYGRTKAGEVANGVGFNASVLRTSSMAWSLPDVRIEKLNRTHDLASTQHHFSMEGRGLIQVETLVDYKIDPRKAQEAKPDPPSQENLYPPYEYKNHAWAMSIDLNTCVGCNACIVACQSENNIPVVGKDQVLKGREMHWLRVDRYFEGPPDEPSIHFQPVACMQCEDAPCEVVCPVGATVHSSEGLNDMVYNRCVGTRYCSNNCPYKVRRFNFLQYSDVTHPTIALQKNPDVTVRSRGVMEKCTYCVQRIESARIDAQKEMRPIREGEIITACQSACPAEAIVFGDINDPNSRVSRLKSLPRNYGLLADLNTHPRTTYLAKVTNPPTT